MSERLSKLSFKNPLVPVAAALIISSVLFLTRDKPQAEPPPEPVVNVRVAIAAVADRSPSVSLYGRMEARQSSVLTAAVNADVRDVKVAPGQTVEREQVLVLLDDREAALALRQAEAELQLLEAQGRTDALALETEGRALALAEREVGRFEDLKKRSLSSQSALDSAKLALENQRLAFAQRQLAVNQFNSRKNQAQAKFDRAQLDLDRTVIRAPYNGLVTEVQISVGDRVSPGEMIISLYEPASLEVRATIPDKYLAAVRSGLEAGSLDAQLFAAGEQFSAQLVRLAASRMATNGGTDAYFRVERSAAAVLVPGRSVALRLALPKVPGTIAVPFEAIYGLDTVYKIQSDRLMPVAVQRLGSFYPPAGEAQLLISSPQLATGDSILVTQLPTAASGTRVKIVNDGTHDVVPLTPAPPAL